jgi:hypothetical protein
VPIKNKKDPSKIHIQILLPHTLKQGQNKFKDLKPGHGILCSSKLKTIF